MPLSQSNKGFTLVEMVVTVAVIAILISLSMPAIFDYMRQRDAQREETSLSEIRKALDAYLAATGALPSESTWYTQLAGYSSMSAAEIQNDTWGRPRMFVKYENTAGRSMQNTPVRIFYATIHSSGVNGIAENKYKNASGATATVAGISLNTTSTPVGFTGATANGSSWWKNAGGSSTPQTAAQAKLVVDSFSALRPGGDDHMIRFTNYSDVLDRYNLTIQRLDTLTQALETYSRSKYAERVAGCVTTPNDAACRHGLPERTIYYPRSTVSSANFPDVATGTANGLTARYNNTTAIVTNGSSEATRKTQMQNLMDILGLPRDFCCSALDGKPFFYFSNPRPRTTSGCANRPVSISFTSAPWTYKEEQKLPARVTTVNDATTCG